MMLHIPGVLTPHQVAHCRARLDAAEWVDGRVTAGAQSAQTKRNRQLPESSPVAAELGELILRALSNHFTFISAALPARIYPPLFNRYASGESFGNHVDNAIRGLPGASGQRIRTDVSCTLFFSDPDDYDGGELVVEDTYGTHEVKLPAGDMIVYPSTSLHRVEPVTRGERVASFFWLQSLVRDDWQRHMLFSLDANIQRLRAQLGDAAEVVGLTSHYHNLIRLWAENP